MVVKLADYTKLSNIVLAGRTCWDSFNKGGDYPEPTNDIIDVDRQYLTRIISKFKHESIAEHGVFSFRIQGVSRSLLQEIARHRISSYSVRSTRYTLKQLKLEQPFITYQGSKRTDEVITDEAYERASKYLVWTSNDEVNVFSIRALENLRLSVESGVANDISKYCLVENFKVDLTWTINLRSLRNMLKLRSAKSALLEFRLLARAIFEQVPKEYRFLIEDCMFDKEHIKIC